MNDQQLLQLGLEHVQKTQKKCKHLFIKIDNKHIKCIYCDLVRKPLVMSFK